MPFYVTLLLKKNAFLNVLSNRSNSILSVLLTHILECENRSFKGAVSYFSAYASAHNKLERVERPTFSSLESKMAPSNEGEHGGKRDDSRPKKAPR